MGSLPLGLAVELEEEVDVPEVTGGEEVASEPHEDEELAEKLDKEGADKFSFQKIGWKADEEVGGFERELVGIYV